MKELVPYEISDDQERALSRMADENSADVFIAWWKMGTGKTRLALTAFFLSDLTDCVVITRRIAFGDWVDEIKRCKLDFLVYQNNYEVSSILNLASSKKRVLLLSAGDLKNRPARVPIGQMLVVDELYLFSNPKAKRSQALQRFAIQFKARIGLSATIMPARDNISIYGQLAALSASRMLAKSSTAFREEYQDEMRGRYGRKTVNKEGSDELLLSKLRYVVDLNFPPCRAGVTRQILQVEKSKEQAVKIQQLQKFYELDNKEYDYAIQVCNVVNGISNGWWVDSSGVLLHYESPKLERLKVLMADLVSSGNRIVVWCAYHNDIARIESELDCESLRFTGLETFDKKKWDSGTVPVVLATEANGSSVNHFGDVEFAVYFSIDYKLLNLEQSMGRHERKSSTHNGAHYYFLQTKGTLDARIYNLVNESKKTEQELVTQLASEICNLR